MADSGLISRGRQIDAGTIPWVPPWAGGPTLSLPINANTDKPHSSIKILLSNRALLMLDANQQTTLDFQFMSLDQTIDCRLEDASQLRAR